MKVDERVQKSGNNRVNLPVEASGMLITIRSGDFVVRGKSYTLAEDEEYEVQEYEEDSVLLGSLVLTKEGDARVFVDERIGASQPFSFAEHSDLTYLRRLFALTLPAHSTSLDDLEMTLYKSEPPEESEEKRIAREKMEAEAADARG